MLTIYDKRNNCELFADKTFYSLTQIDLECSEFVSAIYKQVINESIEAIQDAYTYLTVKLNIQCDGHYVGNLFNLTCTSIAINKFANFLGEE